VEDLFVSRDPYGEYFFYLGAYEASIVKSDTVSSVLASENPVENPCLKGLKVDDSNYIFKHEVTVGFEKDIVDYAQSIIDDERKSDYDNFQTIRGPLELDSKTFGEFMNLTPHLMKVQLQIGSGDDWAAIAVFNKEVAEDVHIKFQFLKVVDGRAIEIITRCTSLNQNIGNIYVPWLELLEKYRDMPMNKFTGANSW